MRQERNLSRRGFLEAMGVFGLAGGAALVGCGRSSVVADKTDAAANANVKTSADDSVSDSSDSSAVGSKPKVLIAYFSATGHTARVATEMAARTGADLFPLTPVEPYTAEDLDYGDSRSRVYREYANADLRDVELASTTPDNFDAYDAVIIGFPIWWNDAAWPILPFCADNDFKDMSYAAFCTSYAPLISDESQLGNARDTIRSLIGTDVDYVAGARFMHDESLNTIDDWVENLAFTTRAQKQRDLQL